MPRGYPDYTYFQVPRGVAAGGTGLISVTQHGVLIGNGASTLNVTAAGNPLDVLQVPAGGGDPAFAALSLNVGGAVTGILPVIHGGTGTATPALVQGSNINISGTWPAQTVALVASPSVSSLTLTSTSAPILTFGASFAGGALTLDNYGNIRAPAGTMAGWDWEVIDKHGTVVLGVLMDGTQAVNLALPLAITSGGTGQASCSAGQLLIASGTNTAAWGTPDGAGVRNSAAESIPSGSTTALTFDTELWNNNNLHSTGTNPSRITIKNAGKYLIVGQIAWASVAAGHQLEAMILKGGITYLAEQDQIQGAAGPLNQNLSCIANLAVAEYVELYVYQNTGAAVNCNGPASAPWFAAQWLGP
jgi:hypothetical protein